MAAWTCRMPDALSSLRKIEPLRRHWFKPNGEGKAQAAGGGDDAGRCGAERPSGKALTTSALRRVAALRALRDHKISQRRVCDLVGVDAKTVRRERLADHADIRKKMHEIAEKRRRFDYPLAGR